MYQESEFRVITGRRTKCRESGTPADQGQNRSDIGREEVLKRSMFPLALEEFVVNQVAPAGPQVVERRELMPAPGRQPIGPAQV